MNRPCFCTWKDDICERPGFKFTNSIWRPYSTLRRRDAIVRLFYGLQKGYSLWQLKPKKGTLRKQLTVNSLPSNLLKKPFFYLHLIDELIYWLKHFDSRNTYLWHPWQVLRVTGSTENPAKVIFYSRSQSLLIFSIFHHRHFFLVYLVPFLILPSCQANIF